MEAQAVFNGSVAGVAAADEEATGTVDLGFEGQGGVGLIINAVDAAFAGFDERGGYFLAAHVHAHGVRLHHSGAPVYVYHQSRQAVAFAVHKAENIILFFIGDSKVQGAAQGVGFGEALGPETTVYGALGEGEHAHGDRTDLAVPDGKKVADSIDHTHEVALFDAGVGAVDRAGEYPRVESLEAFGLSLA